MKNKRNIRYGLIIMLVTGINSYTQAQQTSKGIDSMETTNAITTPAPKGIVRTIKQDNKGNIWITSWHGVYKYDGKSFTNITRKISSARFFSVLEDKNGDLWFASIGSGVYHYNGKSFKHFTTADGLASNAVTNIYEDKQGNIWFGTDAGVSHYNGKSFTNLKLNELPCKVEADSIQAPVFQLSLPKNQWIHNDVNAIIENKDGKLWFATRGYAVVYDGKKFITITRKDGKPFTNVRSMIKDKKGNIWLGGADGLWLYDGKTFNNLTKKFVGYIYEDKKGNIWTSAERADQHDQVPAVNNAKPLAWAISRYDAKSLTSKKPLVTEIAYKTMIFGILEDHQGNIWFGAMDGVYRYDGNTITDFKVTPASQ